MTMMHQGEWFTDTSKNVLDARKHAPCSEILNWKIIIFLLNNVLKENFTMDFSDKKRNSKVIYFYVMS